MCARSRLCDWAGRGTPNRTTVSTGGPNRPPGAPPFTSPDVQVALEATAMD